MMIGKISFYNYFKPYDFCGEPFLKSNLIYVTTNNNDPENMIETLRLRRIFNNNKLRPRWTILIEKNNIKLEFFIIYNDKYFDNRDPLTKNYYFKTIL